MSDGPPSTAGASAATRAEAANRSRQWHWTLNEDAARLVFSPASSSALVHGSGILWAHIDVGDYRTDPSLHVVTKHGAVTKIYRPSLQQETASARPRPDERKLWGRYAKAIAFAESRLDLRLTECLAALPIQSRRFVMSFQGEDVRGYAAQLAALRPGMVAAMVAAATQVRGSLVDFQDAVLEGRPQREMLQMCGRDLELDAESMRRLGWLARHAESLAAPDVIVACARTHFLFDDRPDDPVDYRRWLEFLATNGELLGGEEHRDPGLRRYAAYRSRHWREFLQADDRVLEELLVAFAMKRPRSLVRGRPLEQLAGQARRWDAAERWKKTEERLRRAGRFHFPPQPLPPCYLAALRIVPITDAGRLHAEGERMRHCVATWCESTADGLNYVYSVTAFDAPYTLGLELDEHGLWQVADFRGRKNTAPPPGLDAFVRRWVAREQREETAARRTTVGRVGAGDPGFHEMDHEAFVAERDEWGCPDEVFWGLEGEST